MTVTPEQFKSIIASVHACWNRTPTLADTTPSAQALQTVYEVVATHYSDGAPTVGALVVVRSLPNWVARVVAVDVPNRLARINLGNCEVWERWAELRPCDGDDTPPRDGPHGTLNP